MWLSLNETCFCEDFYTFCLRFSSCSRLCHILCVEQPRVLSRNFAAFFLHIADLSHSSFRTALHGIGDASPDGSLVFNNQRYLKHLNHPYGVSFWLQAKCSQRPLALLHTFINGDTAQSPWRSTFGGIEWDPSIGAENLSMFLNQTHVELGRRGVRRLRVTNQPFDYDKSGNQLLADVLYKEGYIAEITEANYHISVDKPLLVPRLHASERRRLRKCLHAGLRFGEESDPDLDKVHAFVSQARKRKGFPMSLDLAAFQRLFTDLPGVYRVFTVKKEETWAALTVTVRINDRILYNFYPADSEDFLTYSPTVLLTSELYELAYQEGYKLLDLGIATSGGVPNNGLMRFKERLGGVSSPRITYVKEL